MKSLEVQDIAQLTYQHWSFMYAATFKHIYYT